MKKDKFLIGFQFLHYSSVVLFAVFFGLTIYKALFYFPPNPESVIPSRVFADDGETEMAPFVLFGNPDYAERFAPYFRLALTQELKVLLAEKEDSGELKYNRPDGKPWNLYRDGLKIYTTINKELQEHAEAALKTHVSEMQPKFKDQLKGLKRYPYRNLSKEQVARSIKRAQKNSFRYYYQKAAGISERSILKSFETPTPMSVFSWNGNIDTVMTPNDSIIYYKTFLRGGMMSMDPQTGFVKTWVGGPDIRHFPYDCVSQAKRQVGSLIKPFVYATGLSMSVVDPCETFSGGYCVGDWCPGGHASGRMTDGLITSTGATTVPVMSRMGPLAGKENMATLLRQVGIDLPRSQITPPMCLGTMSLSLLEIVSAYTVFANQGIYNPPILVYRIEDRNGHIIYEANPKTKEVLNQNIAYALVSMLKEGVNRGMSARLRRNVKYGGITYPMAAKTGTTQNNSDAWFVGMTPDLITGVWTGGEERAIRWGWTGIGQGASAALPMYGYFMNSVYADSSIQISKGDFLKPPDFDQEWLDCIMGTRSGKKDKGGAYYYYTEPETSDGDNPFL